MMRILTNTTKIERLLSSYAKVDVVRVRRIRELLSASDVNSYDIIYFAKYTPPLIDFGPRNYVSNKVKLVIGIHIPIKIDYVNRPHHIMHNLLMPIQAMHYLRKLRAYLHVLNKDDEEYLMRKASNALSDKIIYEPLFTDINIFKPGGKYDKFTVLYSSRASWQKGTDIATKILKKLIKKYGDKVQVKINAYGPLTHLYNELKGYGNVEINDYMPINEYSRILSESHVLLFTSRYESFGQLPLDALASGTLVVAFNVRGFIRDYVLKDSRLSKFIVDFGDVNGLVNRIVELVNLWYGNEDEYLNIANYARSFAEGFSIDNIARLYVNMFMRVLGS